MKLSSYPRSTILGVPTGKVGNTCCGFAVPILSAAKRALLCGNLGGRGDDMYRNVTWKLDPRLLRFPSIADLGTTLFWEDTLHLHISFSESSKSRSLSTFFCLNAAWLNVAVVRAVALLSAAKKVKESRFMMKPTIKQQRKQHRKKPKQTPGECNGEWWPIPRSINQGLVGKGREHACWLSEGDGTVDW